MNIYNANGKNYKTAYLNSKEKLNFILDKLAAYVNEIANGDPSIITLAGFEATAGTSQSAPELGKISIVDLIVSNVGGQVIIETPAISGKGVSGYGLILVSGPPLTPSNFTNGFFTITASEGQKIVMDFNRKRIKVIDGLDSSIEYKGYVFAINSVGVSPLSDAVRVKCI